MLTSKGKLSRFAAANRTITATCQAMKNTKGQEHQSEGGRKIATTIEQDKSECLLHASIFFYQQKATKPAILSTL